MNASEAGRTVTQELDGRASKICVTVFHTNSAATALTVTPSVTYDGTNYASITSQSISGGASTVSPLVQTFAVSGNDEFATSFEVEGAYGIKLVFGSTSGGASDSIDVQLAIVSES